MDQSYYIFLIIQIVEGFFVYVLLHNTKKSILSKLKVNFEAILQFIGEKSFFDTMNNALEKAQKELDSNVQTEQKLIKDIEDAKQKLANVQGTSNSIRSTIATIEELQ